jgi:class 3 adenylate cyclase
VVAKLFASERSRLPSTAFAYVDANGRRRLPIHDEAHARNALARFERVAFESDAARERARRRLLNGGKRHGIVPIGFITGQLQTERAVRKSDVAHLPAGAVTLLMSDIEGSAKLLHRLGERYAPMLADVRRIHRRAVRRSGGHEIDARADEYFACFEHPSAALAAAITIQRRLLERDFSGARARVRIGIHSGRPTLTDEGYVGMAVHSVARLCAAARGGQIVLSQRAREAIKGTLPEGAALPSRGSHRLRGLPGEHRLFEVLAKGVLSGGKLRT